MGAFLLPSGGDRQNATLSCRSTQCEGHGGSQTGAAIRTAFRLARCRPLPSFQHRLWSGG
jgi:hypothetical protein